MNRRRGAPPPGGKLAAPGPTSKDKRLETVAAWLRNEKRSGLKVKEAVQYERRVDYFKGAKLVDALLSPKNKLKEAPVKSRAEAAKLAQDLLKASYFHRSQRVTHAHSRRWELELLNGPFEEDGLYTWLYEGSKTKLYLMTIGMLVGALGLCMIQIWPLWLKIGVWWCSVTFLTTFGILCVVRLVLFCLMFIFVIGSVGTTIVMASSWVQYSHANSIYVPAEAITWKAIDGGCTIESLHSTSIKRTCSGGNMMRTCSEATLYKHNVVAGGRSYIGPFHLTDFSNGTTTSCWYTDDADAEACYQLWRALTGPSPPYKTHKPCIEEAKQRKLSPRAASPSAAQRLAKFFLIARQDSPLRAAGQPPAHGARRCTRRLYEL